MQARRIVLLLMPMLSACGGSSRLGAEGSAPPETSAKTGLNRANNPPKVWTVNLFPTDPSQGLTGALAVEVRSFAQLPANLQTAIAPEHRRRHFAFVRPIHDLDTPSEQRVEHTPRIKVLDDSEIVRTRLFFEPLFIERGCPNDPVMMHAGLGRTQTLLPKSDLPLLVMRTPTDVSCGWKNEAQAVAAWRLPQGPIWTHVSRVGVRTFDSLAETKAASSYPHQEPPSGLERIDFGTKTLLVEGHPSQPAQFYSIDPVEAHPSALVKRNVVRFTAPFERATCYSLETTGGLPAQPVPVPSRATEGPELMQLAYEWSAEISRPKWDVFVLPVGADFAIATQSETNKDSPQVCAQHIRPIFLRTKKKASKYVETSELEGIDFKREMLVAFGYAGDIPRSIATTRLEKKNGQLIVPVPVTLQMAYCCPPGRHCSTVPNLHKVTSSSVNWYETLSVAHRAPRSSATPKIRFVGQATSSCSSNRYDNEMFERMPKGGSGRAPLLSP